MITIRDVAKAAGVSKSTVSYVLNDDSRISRDTANKVKQAMKQLGYSTNHAARSLSSSKTRTIGISVAPDAGGYYVASVGAYMYALSHYASAEGYETLFVDSSLGGESIRKAVLGKMVDGIIIMDVSDDDPRIDVAVELGIPAVVFGSPHDARGLDEVDADYDAEAVEAVRYLAGRNCDEAMLFSKPEQLVRERMGYATRFNDMFVSTAQRMGMRVHVHAPERVDSNPVEAIGKALEKHPDVNGLALFNESAAMAAPRLFERDISAHLCAEDVIALIPDWIGITMALPFASIWTDVNELSSRAIGMLLERINDPKGSRMCKRVCFPVRAPRR